MSITEKVEEINYMVQNYMFTKEDDQKTTYTVCRYVETKQQIFYNLLDR